MKKIELTQGYFTLVDDEDFEWLSMFSWRVSRTRLVNYARTSKYNKTTKKVDSANMHRIILNAPENMEVDHIDGNGLNNQKCNLRFATRSQNTCNIKKVYGNVSFRGVHKTPNNTYRAMISVKGKKKHVGTYKSAIEAAISYDKAAKDTYGEFAQLNFPTSKP